MKTKRSLDAADLAQLEQSELAGVSGGLQWPSGAFPNGIPWWAQPKPGFPSLPLPGGGLPGGGIPDGIPNGIPVP